MQQNTKYIIITLNFKDLNETTPNSSNTYNATNSNNNNDDDSMLDIVGKGLFYSTGAPVATNNNELNSTTQNSNYENEYLNNSNDNSNQQGMPDVRLIYLFLFLFTF